MQQGIRLELFRKTLAGVLLGAGLSGCGVGVFFPSSLEVTLANPSPLRGSASSVQTIAVAPPLVSGAVSGFGDFSTGQWDVAAVEITERLQSGGRFKVITPNQLQKAVVGNQETGTGGPQPRMDGLGMTGSMTRAERIEFIANAGKSVKAEGIIILQGDWEAHTTGTMVGMSVTGRIESKRKLTMTLLASGSGKTIWEQEAIATITAGSSPPQDREVRSAVVSRLVENFLETMK